MRCCEGLVRHVINPVTQIVVTSHDEDAIFTINYVVEIEHSNPPVESVGEVWGLYSIEEEYGTPTLLIPSSISLTVDGCTYIQAPIFLPLCNLHSLLAGIYPITSTNDFCMLRQLRRNIYTIKYFGRRELYTDWNSTRPRRGSSRLLVMMQESVRFSGSVWVGYINASPCMLDWKSDDRTGKDLKSSLLYSPPSHPNERRGDTVHRCAQFPPPASGV